MLYDWRQSREIVTAFANRDEISREDHDAWWSKRSNAYDFLIYHQDKPVGLTLLEQIDHRNRRCFWGIFIINKKNHRRKGIGRRAANLCFDFAFSYLNIRKIYGTTLPNNKIGRKFHKSLGFTEEAVLKDYSFVDGAYSDLIYISMDFHSWKEHR